MKEELLEVKDLTIRYNNSKEAIIKNLTFDIKKDEILNISGRSGAGKSTIVWAIMEMLEEYNASANGYIRLDNKEIIYENKPLKRRSLTWKEVALVPQASMTAMNPLYTIEKSLLEMLELYEGKQNKYEASKRIEDLLSKVCLKKEVMKAYPHELSGGMKQRASIAMGIMFKPKLLILDEATTGLDLLIQAQVLKTIIDIKKESKMSILFISHDRELAKEFCDRRILL